MPSHTVHRRRGAPAEAFQAKPTLVGARVQHRKYIGAVRRQYASYMTLLLGFCLLGFGAWEFASPSPPPAVGTHWRTGRSLLSSNSTGSDSSHGGVLDTCSYEEDHAPVAWVLFYLLVVYQIFLGIAILCDDHFVPSLEAITEILDLSEDVAGATFMAAGSSAPELFTSLAGIAMGHAEVGAGTIVGSAVFNILVIIALSAALAGEILSVDYRCIVRDGSFYGISIILFIIFSNDSYFYWWESTILLCSYGLYILLMKYNQKYIALMGHIFGIPESSKVAPSDADDASNVTKASGVSNARDGGEDGRGGALGADYGGSDSNLNKGHLRNDTLVSVDQQATHPGGSEANLKPIDNNLATTGSFSVSEPDISKISPEDREHSARFVHKHKGEISEHITGISARVSVRHGNDSPRGSNSAISNKSKSAGGSRLKLDTTDGPGDESDDSMKKNARKTDVSEDEDEDDELLTCTQRCCVPCFFVDRPQPVMAPGISGGDRIIRFLGLLTFIMAAPFAWAFTNSIPVAMKSVKGEDTPRSTGIVVASFCSSIFWIMFLSWVMVFFVIKLGCLIGIDRFTMGLVVIAAGTSVPDALSSVMVARDGFGNMAVSNAIGSNVFDILLGLGFPYLLKALIDGEPLHLIADGTEQAAAYRKFGFILLGILTFTVISFALSRWKLSKGLGVTFFLLYICFVVYAIVQALECDKGADC